MCMFCSQALYTSSINNGHPNIAQNYKEKSRSTDSRGLKGSWRHWCREDSEGGCCPWDLPQCKSRTLRHIRSQPSSHMNKQYQSTCRYCPWSVIHWIFLLRTITPVTFSCLQTWSRLWRIKKRSARIPRHCKQTCSILLFQSKEQIPLLSPRPFLCRWRTRELKGREIANESKGQ